jgi:hypothetical protein
MMHEAAYVTRETEWAVGARGENSNNSVRQYEGEWLRAKALIEIEGDYLTIGNGLRNGRGPLIADLLDKYSKKIERFHVGEVWVLSARGWL